MSRNAEAAQAISDGRSARPQQGERKVTPVKEGPKGLFLTTRRIPVYEIVRPPFHVILPNVQGHVPNLLGR